MTKLLRLLFLLIIFIGTGNSAFAQFPYVESFRASTAPGITFGGAPSAFLTAAGSSAGGGTPIDAEGNGYLRLTNNAKNQKGYVYSNANFPSNNGLRVEFEYYIYGGTGADGISFFLFDATADPFVIGGFGGSLGYAQITTTNPISPGVSKGYLAIGLDEFGNFSNPNEGRQGGTGFFPGSVTLRGKGNGASLDPENYKFLTTSLVSSQGFTLVGDGGQRQPSPTSTGYRRVLMEMEPNPAGGYNITVKITKGGATLTSATVINNYYYPEAAPANLRYGFASSTGDQTNFHEVRNVAIEVFNTGNLSQPVAANDVIAVCKGNTPSFDVSLNDFTNNAGAVMVNSTIDLNPSLGGQQTTNTIAGRGTFSLATNGNILFTPSSLFTGSVSTNYTIKDGYGQTSNVASITINYSEPSVYPSAGSDKIVNVVTIPATTSLSGSEHTGYTGRWTQVSGPNSAIFSNSTSRNTQVNNLINGTYIFRWTISSSGGCESFDDIEVVVNQRPIAVNDNISTNLNTDITIPILANDTDPNGNSTIDNSTIEIKTQPQNGTLVVDGVAGTVIYRPNTGYSGNDSFTYSIKDNFSAESNIATVTIGVSVKPIGTNDNAGTTTNIQIQIPVIDNDPGKDGSTIIASTNPTNGVIVINGDGTISYSPSAGFSGRDSFTYKLKNASNVESDPITVTISVRPTGTVDQATTLSGSAVTLAVKDNDLSKTGTTVITTANPTNGTITVDVLGAVVYTPAAGFSGKDSFTYTLRTADGLESDPVLANINVRPIGTIDYISTPINTPVDIPVKENDISKTGTTVIVNTNPTHGVVSINTSNIATYTPNAGFSGQDNFTYVLRTADGLNSEPISANINIKPVGTNDNVTTPAATPVNIPVKDNDISKTGSSVVINNLPLNGTVAVDATGEVLYTPNGTFSGKDTFKYLLRTADGYESDPITVTVTVKPVGSPDQQNYTLNTPVTINVTDNDLSKTNTSVIINTNPANGTATVNGTGIVTYTPNNGFNGTNTFTYILRTSDGIDSDPITVTVNPSSASPTGSPDIANTISNTPITIPVKDNDASKVGTTVVIDSSPANGTVAINGAGDPMYTPASGFSGKDTFTYRLRNNTGGLESASITVTVNVKPVGSPDNGIFTVNTPLNIDVKNNDLSKNNTTVIINTNPANGTVIVGGTGIVTYTPNAGYSGNDGFTYVLRTNDGLNSDPINVAVTGTTVSVRPSGSPDIATTPTNTPVTIPVKNNDASNTGTTVLIQASPTNGSVTLNTSGEAIYTPTTGFSGKDTFTYILRDNNGLQSDPISVTVNVKPIGTNDNAATQVNKPVTIEIKNNDQSKTGTTPVINTNPAHGTITIDGAGNALYTPVAGYVGGDSFTYKLRTTDGVESDPIVVVVIVTPTSQVPDIVVNVPTDKPVTIDIPIPTGGTIIITSPPKHGTITFDPVTGKPIYTPNPGYTGPDDFEYVVKDAAGNENTVGKVTITVVRPPKIGLAKALVSSIRSDASTFKLTYIFTLRNYGDAVINQLNLVDNLSAAFPARVFSITKLTGSGTLRINPGFNGTTATEMLLSSSTLNVGASETIELEVTLTVNQQSGTFLNTATVLGRSVGDGTTISDISTSGLIPDPTTPGDVSPANPTQAIILVAPNISVPVSSGQPVTVNVTVPPGGSVVILNPPANGTITFDPNTGQPIYTPNPGYSGPDEFTYIIKDANGNESLPGTISLTVTAPAKIGLAKALLANNKNIDGTFNLTYQFTLVNYGDVAIQNLSLTDNLNLAFLGAKFEIVNITTTGDLRVNTQYNGTSVLNMLLPTSTMAAKTKEFVEMQVRIILDRDKATFNNFAVAEGASAGNGAITTDQSTNGFNPDPDVPGNVTPSVLTPVTLTKELLKIPGGFSPNNDGINDFFVIENAQGKKIELEIFNRWGNRVYKSKDYQNTWNGISNEGIRIGEDLPVGTYYYIIKIEGENKRVGYITINR